ncbi:hypothetical protein DPMN_185631 [Dreissena polymorpha]|uniref:Uncharacterized protein n=1 Tax=Dreissena polymorpha TaxID=45954 RepID=A0A9D4DN60_DREPO|nr:hypothetical protein DPMN_185631 [Dreissena polymorpha]
MSIYSIFTKPFLLALSTYLSVDSSTGALNVATDKTLTSATSGGNVTTITADAGLNATDSADGTTVVHPLQRSWTNHVHGYPSADPTTAN